MTQDTNLEAQVKRFTAPGGFIPINLDTTGEMAALIAQLWEESQARNAEVEALRSALRKAMVKQHMEHFYPSGIQCHLCGTYWPDNIEGQHMPECLCALAHDKQEG